MCYYNGIRFPTEGLIRLKNLEIAVANTPINWNVLFNGFDYPQYPVLYKSPDNNKVEFRLMEWGFLPPYITSKEKTIAFRQGYTRSDGKWQVPINTLNARGEELLLPNKIYREAALKRRCLILSSGFYEWRHIHPLSAKTGKPLKTTEKYPYYITLKNKEYFFIAGIWQPWHDRQTGEYKETFSLITTQANQLMEQIHNIKKRMPTVLTDDLAFRWVTEDLTEKEISEISTFQIPADHMNAITLSKNFRESLTPVQEFNYPSLPKIIAG